MGLWNAAGRLCLRLSLFMQFVKYNIDNIYNYINTINWIDDKDFFKLDQQ